MEIVDIKKILARNLLIYVHIHIFIVVGDYCAFSHNLGHTEKNLDLPNSWEFREVDIPSDS